MHAVVFHGPGQKSWEEVPKPEIVDDTDAIVRVDAVTICGTDLHILKGDVPAMTPGRHDRECRHRREDPEGRRQGARVLHHRLRHLPLLP